MVARLLVLTACFLGTTAYVSRAMQPELVPLREPLSDISLRLDDWTGFEAPRLTSEVLAVLGVDEYVTRVYARQKDVVGLYIGYYQSQRQGDTMHSPMNCLPGAGWQPMETARIDVPVPGRDTPITVNQVIIQKGVDRQLVLYWYQSHGRVVASEYWSKIFMVTDAIRSNRSDAALVRVISGIDSRDKGRDAEARAVGFVQALFPQLSRYLPS
jgi:EpsI family protein